jgi:hypothetical protein
MIGPCFVGFVVALVGCGLSLGCLVFLVTLFGLLCGLFSCSFLGFGVFSVGFVDCCGLALGVSSIYFMCT